MKQQDVDSVKTVESLAPGPAAPPDPEVEAQPRRRRFTAEYKLRVLRQAEACSHGELGGLLRREGLYSSHLDTWREQRQRGELAGLTAQKRGRKPVERNPLQPEVDKLRGEVARLEGRLKQTELIVEVQKKLCQILGLQTEATPESEQK